MWLTLYSVSQYSPLDKLAGRSVTVESSSVNVESAWGLRPGDEMLSQFMRQTRYACNQHLA
jgi:hypothetical protein